MRRTVVEPGKKYGHLTALSFSHINKKGHQMWWFECDCKDHTKKQIVASFVLTGHTTSCGCRANDGHNNYRHGLCRDRIYRIYHHMIERCYKPSCKEYKNYGERGVKVCDEWRESFLAFNKWAIENGYKDNLTIDRIDVNGNYEPSNCRWTTQKIQQNNRRNNHIITIDGVSHTISEWGEITGVGCDNIYARLKLGWDEKRAVFQKVKRKGENNE